jgi:hypothetical protein
MHACFFVPAILRVLVYLPELIRNPVGSDIRPRGLTPRAKGLAIHHFQSTRSMVRPLLIELAGELYHVSSRADRRDAIYPGDADGLATIRSGCSRRMMVATAPGHVPRGTHRGAVEVPDPGLSMGDRSKRSIRCCAHVSVGGWSSVGRPVPMPWTASLAHAPAYRFGARSAPRSY